MKKILFISHDASRTGAPLILLSFLKWLNANVENIQMDILLVNRGKVEPEFREQCTQVFDYTNVHRPPKFLEILRYKTTSRLGMRPNDKEALFLKKVVANNYDLIYANSIVSIPIAVKIKKASSTAKLIVHVHELKTILKMALPDFGAYKEHIDKFIAVSHHVKENLMVSYKIDAGLIEVIYEFAVNQGTAANKNSDQFTVGASGNVHWRKGHDLFILVANYIHKNYPEANVNFKWVGSKVGYEAILEGDIEKLALDKSVAFVGEQANPIELYKDFDLFVLTSREDPFPLVCIEIAGLKKPIICFDKASGSAEIIKNGGGFVVPYLDIEAMGEKIMHYYFNRDELKKDGEKAQELFSKFTAENICPLLYKQILPLLADK